MIVTGHVTMKAARDSVPMHCFEGMLSTGTLKRRKDQ